MNNNVVNFSDNPNVKLCVNVKGLVVESKTIDVKDSKDKFTYNEYSLVIEVLPNVYMRCVVKIDSKQKQMIDQFGALNVLDDKVPYAIK